jgi:hypothetical protein
VQVHPREHPGVKKLAWQQSLLCCPPSLSPPKAFPPSPQTLAPSPSPRPPPPQVSQHRQGSGQGGGKQAALIKVGVGRPAAGAMGWIEGGMRTRQLALRCTGRPLQPAPRLGLLASSVRSPWISLLRPRTRPITDSNPLCLQTTNPQLEDLLQVLRRDPRNARKLARIRELLQKKVGWGSWSLGPLQGVGHTPRPPTLLKPHPIS